MNGASRSALFAVAATLFSRPVAARVPCAGDGPPIYASDEGYAPASEGAIDPTALVTLQASPWVGKDASRRDGDPVADAGVELARARLGVCGYSDHLAYRIVYEPWDAIERSRTDATAWGRFVDAEVAWLPFDWATVTLGIGKVPFGRGREQPAGALAVGQLPFATAAIAPDRRLGLSVDADSGVFRLGLGAYEGARAPSIDTPGGVMLVARGQLEPFGPVGRRTWPEYGGWTARLRPATGLSAAYLLRGGATAYAVAADVSLAWRRVIVDGEVMFADRWPLERPTPDPAARARRLGAFVEALAILVAPWVALAARVEYLDENLAAPGRYRYLAVAGGASVYLLGPALQLQASYAHKFHLVGSYSDDVLSLALTVSR